MSEAVETAKALGWSRPVKVQWTRENDMRGGRYRPAYVHAMKAGLDKDGRIVAWSNHIVGQSIMSGTLFEGMAVKNGIDFTSVEGAANIPYAIPNLNVGLSTMQAGVPVLWWRAVGSTHTAYAVEAFLDEVAEAAGKDPVALRLELLEKHPRHTATLKLAAEKAGWGTAPAAGRFRGVAVAEVFNTVVAQVAEISIPGPGQIKVERVVCAVDCGTAINPDQVVAQMQGGIGFGLSSILGEEITLTAGVVDQGNYDSYTPLRIEQMPKVEVHIVPSEAAPTGAGEPGVPPDRTGAGQCRLSGDEEADSDPAVLEGVYGVDDLFDCEAETSAASSAMNAGRMAAAGVENAPGLVVSKAYVYGRLLQQSLRDRKSPPRSPHPPGVAVLAVAEWRRSSGWTPYGAHRVRFRRAGAGEPM